MKPLSFTLLALTLISFAPVPPAAAPQTRDRVITKTKDRDEVVKVDVDLIVLDALVLQKETGRVVGDLKKEDFILEEDGAKQEIAHFSQDTLPLSVILLIDRGGCLDPFGSEVHRAALDAVSRLKPTDEVAVMGYHESVDLIQGFTRERDMIAQALDRVPGHDEEADHCLNRAFYNAAQYMIRAGNPAGRRVIIAITGVTSNFDCGGPSGTEATHEVLESGSVVCGLIPKSAGQRIESGLNKFATRTAGVFKVHSLSIDKLAEETGGEVLDDKPENLDRAFNTLVEHLRTRYSMGFVSTNKKHDGGVRKLRLKLTPSIEKAKTKAKLVVKTRRSYIAPRA
ncbi:MAG: VWA domain-containing protein [Pyrinomonadaceae bacterium]